MGRLLRSARDALVRALSAPNHPGMIMVIGFALVIAGVALVAALIELWPAIHPADAGRPGAATEHEVGFLFGLFTIQLTADTALLVLVLVAGSIGAFIHAATSFGDFVGNRTFVASWGWWYALRIFVGATLALLLYFAVRGGFLSGSSSTTDVNEYGVAALAGLAGLFSKQATDKLREVFTTMFRVSEQGGDAQRKDSLNAPAITAAMPSPGTQGQSNDVTLTGTGLLATSKVTAGGQPLATTFDGKALQVTIPAALATGESVKLVVQNSEGEGGSSEPFDYPLS